MSKDEYLYYQVRTDTCMNLHLYYNHKEDNPSQTACLGQSLMVDPPMREDPRKDLELDLSNQKDFSLFVEEATVSSDPRHSPVAVPTFYSEIINIITNP